MAYIGPAPNPGQNREVDDISSGFNGSEVNFTLQVNSQNVSPGSPNNIIVSLGGVVQNPSTDYNIAASTITFTTAPASGLSFFGVVLGQQVDIQSLADGTSPTMSAPSITGDLSIADKIVHTGDTNTAIRFPAADTVSIETSGSEKIRVDSSGLIGIGTTSPEDSLHLKSGKLRIENAIVSNNDSTISYDNADFIVDVDPNNVRGSSSFQVKIDTVVGLTVDDNRRLLIGHTTSLPAANAEFSFQVLGTSFATTSVTQQRYADDVSGPSIILAKSRGSLGNHTIVNNGDELGKIRFYGSDGNDFNNYGAEIKAQCDGTPGNNDMPGRLVFSTTADGAASPTERIRINSYGGVNVGSGALTSNVADGNIFVDEGIYIGSFNGDNQIRHTSAGGGSSTLYIGNQAIQTSSDRRIKQNIVDTEIDALLKLEKVKVVDFNWNDPSDKAINNKNARGKWTGCIAQEIVDIFPHAVNAPRKEDTLEIDYESERNWLVEYGNLVPILIKSIQELSAKITTLESEVAALKAA